MSILLLQFQFVLNPQIEPLAIQGMDDPRKPNPVTTPLEDITYTLQVTNGCNTTVRDEVFVKVYKD